MIKTIILAAVLAGSYPFFLPYIKNQYEKQERPLITERDPEFEKTVTQLNTPEKVSSYVKENFTYDTALLKSIQTPLETFRKKAGVCRHFAAFGTWCLKRAGYDAHNLTYWWFDEKRTKRGHTVCIIKQTDGDKTVFRVPVNSGKPGEVTGPYRSVEQMLSELVSFPVVDHRVEDTRTLMERNRSAFEPRSGKR